MKVLAHILAYLDRWRLLRAFVPAGVTPTGCAPLPVDPPTNPPVIYVDYCGQAHEMDDDFCAQVENWNRIVLNTPTARWQPVRQPETIQ